MQSNARYRSKKDDYKPRSEHLTSASIPSASHQSGGRGAWAEDDCNHTSTGTQAHALLSQRSFTPQNCPPRFLSRFFVIPFLSEHDSIQGYTFHSPPGGFNEVLASELGGWKAVEAE